MDWFRSSARKGGSWMEKGNRESTVYEWIWLTWRLRKG